MKHTYSWMKSNSPAVEIDHRPPADRTNAQQPFSQGGACGEGEGRNEASTQRIQRQTDGRIFDHSAHICKRLSPTVMSSVHGLNIELFGVWTSATYLPLEVRIRSQQNDRSVDISSGNVDTQVTDVQTRAGRQWSTTSSEIVGSHRFVVDDPCRPPRQQRFPPAMLSKNSSSRDAGHDDQR
jgi:hypothetical protein